MDVLQWVNMSTHKNQVQQLEKLRAEADKTAAAASRWPQLLDSAQAAFAAAEVNFLAGLDAKTAAALAAASDDVRKLAVACATLEKAGGPEGFRTRALRSPEAFALLSAGFANRLAALENLKPAARILYASRSADAIESGRVTDVLSALSCDHLPDVAEARALVDSLDRQAQAALVARNTCANPQHHQPHRPFDALLDELDVPLPVVPTA